MTARRRKWRNIVASVAERWLEAAAMQKLTDPRKLPAARVWPVNHQGRCYLRRSIEASVSRLGRRGVL
jgi:hypothetical protein